MKISACIITYNHEDFIADCIQGALSQIVNIDYEIIIGEDCSTDNTFAICESYALKYPDKIKLLKRDKNLALSGNWIDTLKACTGDYIAICEGDDYWTDSDKLQRQIEILNNNNQFVFTFHDSKIMNINTNKEHLRVGNKTIDDEPNLISVIKNNHIRTETMVFRNILDWDNLPFWFKNTLKIDFALIFLLLENQGRAIYLNRVMSVSRVHNKTLWSSKSVDVHHQEGLIFFNNLFAHSKENEVKAVLKKRIKFIKANRGIKKIRDGKIFIGLFDVIFYNNWFSQTLTIKTRKIGSALKESILKVYRK